MKQLINFNDKEYNLIQYILKYGENKTWLELANEFSIAQDKTEIQRAKKANDIWRKFKKVNPDLTITKIVKDKKGIVINQIMYK